MKITVKFMGTLGQEVFGDRQSKTIELELATGTPVGYLFKLYDLPLSKEYTTVINNKVAKPDDLLGDGMEVFFFQAIYGG